MEKILTILKVSMVTDISKSDSDINKQNITFDSFSVHINQENQGLAAQKNNSSVI